MAIIVIPIAFYMMKKGFKKHGRKWVVALGSAGIVFIVVGAILPYVEAGQPSEELANVTAPAESSAELEEDVPG